MGDFAKLFQRTKSPSADNQIDTDLCVSFKQQSRVELSTLPEEHPHYLRHTSIHSAPTRAFGAAPVGPGASPQNQCEWCEPV